MIPKSPRLCQSPAVRDGRCVFAVIGLDRPIWGKGRVPVGNFCRPSPSPEGPSFETPGHDYKEDDQDMSLRRRTAFAKTGVAVFTGALVLTAAAVGASAATGPHFSTPKPGTTIHGNLKSGTTLDFAGTINGVPITVMCTKFTATGKAPSTGLTVTLSAPPTISGCTDSLGGGDTITTNQTNGKWKVIETLASTGDKVSLEVPKAGATFKSNVLSGCVITAAPSGTAKITGKYNNKNTVTDSNAPVPVKGSGCTASSPAKATGTIILTPNVVGVS